MTSSSITYFVHSAHIVYKKKKKKKKKKKFPNIQDCPSDRVFLSFLFLFFLTGILTPPEVFRDPLRAVLRPICRRRQGGGGGLSGGSPRLVI